jgi:Flp pilus assembly protein TadD
MKYQTVFILLFIAGLAQVAGEARASDESSFLEPIQMPSEQALGSGHSVVWTMPLVAVQYRPRQPTPAIEAALQAQNEDRFLDAMVALDEADKAGQMGVDAKAETNLLRASFLLQGNQSQDALALLAPMLADTQYAADASALTAMAYLQQGKMQQALETAQRAHDLVAGVLPHLSLSYALQGTGRLDEAYKELHEFNGLPPQSAVTLAREAELALTLGQVQQARMLAAQAREMDAANPYVTAVGGLVYLIDGQAQKASGAFAMALKRDPKDAKALLGLGLAEIKMGNFQAGQEKLQAANESTPNNALILTYLGRSQQHLGQTAEARESWQSAQAADTKDPVPWLYQAQAELQANRPLDARESLREAEARIGNRSVYRGEKLLKEDRQLLQANEAEVERQLGLESLAFHTLSDTVAEKNSASLRNQADLLQGQRYAESARRSLLLQSWFDEKPGNLPSELDIYGDGAGQTGASVPQHGVVSQLNSQEASYNNYDALFGQPVSLAADATVGNRNTSGGQIRAGVGSDTLGVSLAGLQFKTAGFGSYQNLDNRVTLGMVQWRPAPSTQAFASYQTFSSDHGETKCPADPYGCTVVHQYTDSSSVTRLGLRQSLDGNSELRGLISHQQTGQTDNYQWGTDFLSSDFVTNVLGLPYQTQGTTYGIFDNSSAANSGELQYRSAGAGYAAQWGVSADRTLRNIQSFSSPPTNVAQQIYVDWQQTLNPRWQLEAGLAWGKNDKLQTSNNTYLRSWLPKLGLVYAPDSTTHVRFAAWKNLDNAAVGNASLAPAQLAGIVLNRQSDIYELVRGVALGADKQLDAAWLLEGQAQRRWADQPISVAGGQIINTMLIDESRLALHWQPDSHAFNATLAYDDELAQNPPFPEALESPDSVLRQHLRSEQLNLRWFASPQWTANLDWSYNLLNATQESYDVNYSPILLDVRQHFSQANASVNWRFSRHGSLDAGVRNATNTGILYVEQDPLIPRFPQGRLEYAMLKFVW